MNRKSAKKIISMILVILMSFSSMVFATGGDYLGHWAEGSIQSWIDKGYVKGYVDGSFRPENDITRAEFISVVNRSFGFTEEAEVVFKDVADTHWAYNEFKVASAAGYIGGFEDGTVRPNDTIKRQEMASIITRLLNLNAAKDSDAFLDLDDVDTIPEWSAGAVSALVDKGYIKLRDGNSFAPTLAATRAEVIDALNNGYLSVTKVKYDEAGTYTADVVDGSVEINAKDVILEDTTINGDLIIGEEVGNGDVTLNNVTVKGNTIVKGGGMNSIIIIDSEIKNLIVEKKDGKVRILAKGDTFINNVEMKSGGKLESSDKDADNFGYVVIAENLSSNEPIILAGNFKNVEVKSGKNEIKVISGTIENLVISKTAKGAKIDLAEGVKVEKLTVNAAATVEGKGKIGTAVVNADGVKITATVDKMEVADGVKKPETTKPSTGGGGGSSSSDDSDDTTTGPAIDVPLIPLVPPTPVEEDNSLIPLEPSFVRPGKISKTDSGAKITLTSGAAINITTSEAITFTTAGAINFTTAGKIKLQATGQPANNKIVWKFSSEKVVNLLKEEKITATEALKSEIIIDKVGYITFYQIDTNDTVVSYVSVQITNEKIK